MARRIMRQEMEEKLERRRRRRKTAKSKGVGGWRSSKCVREHVVNLCRSLMFQAM